MNTAGFQSRGFYLHASWQYDYPLAVRTWERRDYAAMFDLLRALGMNRVMIWPMTELAPPPLSSADREHFRSFSDTVADAAARELECWLVFCANLSCSEAVRPFAMRDRVFYPNMRTFRLDVPGQREAHAAHLRDLLGCLDNADGYVFIDGDPGGYPGARPEEFIGLLRTARAALARRRAGNPPKIVPWVWSGWGADRKNEEFWKLELRPLVEPFLAALKADPPVGPWELLPGRSIRDGHANGRINFSLAEEAGLMDRSTLLTYEIVEYEPTPPAFVLQFDDIRRVIREELRWAPAVRGIMANAQQPVSALHNLFYFAQCARDPAWLERSDGDVLLALADFLGGDAKIWALAWKAAQSDLHELPEDLADRVRGATLQAEPARMIPGGPALYGSLVADFVQARIAVLRHARQADRPAGRAVRGFTDAALAVLRWWARHHYVQTGGAGPEFRAEHTHAVLLEPLAAWARSLGSPLDDAREDVIAELAGSGIVSRAAAARFVNKLAPPVS